MMLEIPVGSVDRGACIRDFSQYPAEVEYLWVPCSYIEPAGYSYLHVIPDGVVKVVPVRMNANLKALTIEELVGQKKTMHLSAFRLVLDETKQELHRLAETGGAEEILRVDKFYSECQTMDKFINHIMVQCEDVYKVQADLAGEEYAHDETYRGLIQEMLDTKQFACSKLLWWMEDDTRNLQHMGMGKWKSADANGARLRDAHYNRIAFLTVRMNLLEDGSDEKRDVALKLCQLGGLVAKAVNETNSLGETPFWSASVTGKPVESLELLKLAGADIDFMVDGVKSTALSSAVIVHDHKRVEALARLGVNLERPVNGVLTAMILAVNTEDYDMVRLLASLGASTTKGIIYRQGPVDFAKRLKDGSKMVDLLEELQNNPSGNTPAT